MKKEFFLFRHGQTQWNLEKRCQGQTDIPLNETGLKQAKELANKFSEINLEVIYSSDLKRAFQTAEIISYEKGIPLLTSEKLREFSLGEAEGKTKDDLIQSYGIELWENFLSINREKDNISYPKGESRSEVYKRTIKILNTISEETKYTKIAIATHGGTLRNLIFHLSPKLDEQISTPNCSVFKVDYFTREKSWEFKGQPF